MKRLPVALVLACSLVLPRFAAAQEAQSRPLQVNVPIDLSVTLGLGAVWIGSELGKKSLVTSSCRWCGRNGFDEAVRNSLWAPGHEKAVGTLSDISGFLLVPTLAYGNLAFASREAGAPKQFWTDALIVTEATTAAAVLNQATKFLVARERPFVRNNAASSAPLNHSTADENLSFYSGHTTLAFSMAAASGTVAQMRGYSSAGFIWASGLTLATGVGVMRIVADKHYASDVLVGAALGTAVGVLVPRIFHSQASTAASTSSPMIRAVSPEFTPHGATVTVGGVF
jgi:membrane-associated phospholipid phosphatase